MSLLSAMLVLVSSAPPGLSPKPALLKIEADDSVSEGRSDALTAACEEVGRQLGSGKKRLVLPLRQAPTTAEFVQRTWRFPFEAAAMVEGTLWLQPDPVLDRLQRLDEVLRHECVHAWLRALGVPPLPRSLEEALALGVSGQAAHIPPAGRIAHSELSTVEMILRQPEDAAPFEATLARAVSTFWPRLDELWKAGTLLPELKKRVKGPHWTRELWAFVVPAPPF